MSVVCVSIHVHECACVTACGVCESARVRCETVVPVCARVRLRVHLRGYECADM